MADKEKLCGMIQMSIFFSFLLFFPLSFSKMRRKDPLTVNNYLKAPSAWIICRAITAGLSLNSILRGKPNIIPERSGFGPLSVHSGLPKKHLHTL